MTTDVPKETGVLVIGGGPGGYSAAIELGRAGHDVTLVSDEPVGGTCLHHGCIPSKALLSATKRVADVSTAEAERMGIYADPYVEVPQLDDWKNGVIDELTEGVAGLCRSSGVVLVDGHATFTDERTVNIETNDGEAALEFEHAVIATGSRPIEIPNFSFGDDPVLDSRAALSLETVPDELVVVGGGYIGMELSTVFARLGTAVTVVEALDTALPAFDDDLAEPVMDRARDLGIAFQFGEAADSWEHIDRGVRVHTNDGTYTGEAVLVAVGREPVAETVGLDAAGVSLTEDGFVSVDNECRTDVEHIFAIGDVTGGELLAHKAMHEGKRAAAVIAGVEPPPVTTVPAVVFTDPEIGVVGHTAAEADAEGVETISGLYRFAASSRALTAGDTAGFARIVAAEDSGRILGAQVVGPHASEILSEATIAVQNELTLAHVTNTIHTHPTFGEVWQEAATNAERKREMAAE